MSLKINGSAVRRKDSSQCIKGCGFTASVFANDSKDLSLAYIEGNSFNGNKAVYAAAFKLQ